jgi:formate-dependent nitrite reductase membrane component NrfD
VSSALGLAMMTALVQDNSAQFIADRSTLLETGSNPQLTELQQQGAAGLLPLYQQVAGQVQAAAYSSGFFIAGSLTLVGVVLALFLRSGKPAGGGDRPVAH